MGAHIYRFHCIMTGLCTNFDIIIIIVDVKRDELMRRRKEEREDKLRDYAVERDEKIAARQKKLRKRLKGKGGSPADLADSAARVAAAAKEESDVAASKVNKNLH